MDLTDEQWSIIQPLIPDPPRRSDGKGRPWKDARDIINGVLWIYTACTEVHHYGMTCPTDIYPPYQTCHHRRFQQWVRSGVFEKILHALAAADDLRERGGRIDLSECFIDGTTFIVAKKRRGNKVGATTKRGRGTKVMAIISDSADGLPVAIYTFCICCCCFAA